jgi:uncharacterized membrane protein YdbT with pleckstrin-like domain
MSYISKLLGANETILIRTKRHFFVLLSMVLKEILLLLIFVGVIVFLEYRQIGNPIVEIGIGIAAFLVVISIIVDIMRFRSEEFIVTNRRVLHSRGVFSKNVLDSSLSKINDVILQQSFFGRMFGYGTIKILTASDEVINTLDRISNPVGFKQAMLNAKADLEPGMVASVAAPSRTATELLEELEQLRARKMITDAEFEEKRKDIIKRM